ncbi:MAG: hypothetical protein IT371_03990 [Deltaproteobacteria bacterium]|nr:hypothetical protein [Deltaproteobacteria bacterium]
MRRVTVTVSGPGISTPVVQDLVKVGGKWQGTIGAIPVGADRSFQADAYDAGGALVYGGRASAVTIAKGTPAAVLVVLQEKNPPAPFGNAVPLIDALVASAAGVAPGETVGLIVQAHDTDAGDSLSYAWTAGTGTFDNAASATPVWTAPPSDQTVTFAVTVSDGRGGSQTASLTVQVAAQFARGAAQVNTEFNNWPTVNALSANPGRVAPGQVTAVTLAASDADGDALAFAWSDGGCGGSFSSISVASPSYTAPASAPASGRCSLQVTVTDGRGGSTTGTLVVPVAVDPTANVAPIVDTSFASNLSPNGSEQVTFRVVAHDPEGGAVTIAWSATGGTLGTPTGSGGSSELVWTAPSCFPATPAPSVTATITDLGGAVTTQVFALTPPASAACLIVTDAATQALWRGQTGDAQMPLSVLSSGALLLWPAMHTFEPATGARTTKPLVMPNDGVYRGGPGYGYVVLPRPSGPDWILSGFENAHIFDSDSTWIWSWVGPGCCHYSQNYAVDVARGTFWWNAWGGANPIVASPPTTSGHVSPANGGHNTLAIAGDHIYLTGETGYAQRVNTQTRTQVYRVQVDPAGALYQGAVDTDDAFVVASSTADHGRLARISPSGSVEFNQDVGARTTPVVAANGTIFVGTSVAGAHGLRAVKRDGTTLWTASLSKLPMELLLGDDGLVYAYLYGAPGEVVALTQTTGSLKRQYLNLETNAGAGQLVLASGRLFVKTNSYVYALPTGAQNYNPADPWPVRYHDNMLQRYRR